MNALLALHVFTRRLLVTAPEVSSSGAAAGGGWPLAAWEKGWQPGLRLFPPGNRRPKPPSVPKQCADSTLQRLVDSQMNHSQSLSIFPRSNPPLYLCFRCGPKGPIAEGLGAVPMARVKLNARHVRPSISQGNECLHVLGHALGCITV